MNQDKTVVIGLSGGVDSSVAAHLLIEQGYNVVGMFMKNWHDTSVTISDDCPWEEDANDALLVADQLGIPFHTVDLSTEYQSRIVDYMFSEYKKGRTPNPDVLCNREIKFDVFLRHALKLGADFVATGHYCRKNITEHQGVKHYHLISGKDPNKDQSYFLCQLNQSQLEKTLFPIGDLLKPQVREIAENIGLNNAKKKDSQGLCFIGKVKLPDFLKQKLKPKEGDIIEIPNDHELYSEKRGTIELKAIPYTYGPEDGVNKGKHQGAHYFTIGQRKGLDVGGTPLPLFVIATDVHSNTVYVGQGDDHPGLSRAALFIKNDELHWLDDVNIMNDGESRDYMVRIRYRQDLVEATLLKTKEGMYIHFKDDMKSITAGQFAAWYDGDELLGSGVINA